jgi:hypothetical protein
MVRRQIRGQTMAGVSSMHDLLEAQVRRASENLLITYPISSSTLS